tara:strand:+ start:94 stop:729 length:636 start_codon:yes stop_codon:yes gene_type:complete
MIETILASLDKFVAIPILIFLSLVLRFMMTSFAGQKWAETMSHTSTLVFLPIITFVITNVIYGNVALSLGMVGALSIVRFRNPVKSPLELALYFACITMGIAAGVSLNWLFFLVAGIILASFVLLIVNYLSDLLFNKPFFRSSFSEGNQLSTLEVKSNERIESLSESRYLMSESYNGNEYSYILSSDKFGNLKQIFDMLDNNQIINKTIRN